MANGLKIKRGDGTPVAGSDGSNGVWPFELAYDYTNNKLYINDGQGGGNGNMQEIGGGTITSVTGMTNNNVLTASGSTTISGEGSLTFDGTNLDLPNSKKIRLGDSQDLEIYHDGTNSVINNTQTGALQIYNNVDNGMVELLTDNGSGGTQVFLRADGANNMVRMPVDGVKFTLGDASDLQLYHDGSNNYLRNNTTNQDFSILVNDGGTTKTALTIDSSENALITTHGNLTVGGQVNIQDTNAIVKRNSGQMELLTYGGYNIDLNPAGDVRIDGASLVFKNNAEYIYNTDASGTSTRMFGINGSNHTYIGPIDNYAGGLVLYGTNSNVTGHIFYSGGVERWQITSSGTLQGNNRAITGIGGIYGNGGDLTLYNNTYNFKSSTSADLMKLTTTGLGIGTTSPAEKLHVVGNVMISNNTFFMGEDADGDDIGLLGLHSNNNCYVGPKDNAYAGGFMLYGAASNTSGHVWYSGNAEAMRIDSSQRVGIGTNSPSKKFVVKGASGDQARFEHNGAVGSVDIYSGTDGGLINVRNASGTSIIELDGRSGNLELPYGRITDAGTDMNIVSDNALTLGTESGTALTIANASTTVVTTAIKDTATGLGFTGNISLDNVTNTAAEYSALPVGYSRMMHANLGVDEGMPKDNQYFHFTKIANRDAGGGWGGIAIAYNDGADSYIGTTTTSSSFASWRKIISQDANGFVGIGSTASHKLHITSGTSNSALRIDADASRGANRYALDIQDDDGNARGVVRARSTAGTNTPIYIAEGNDHDYIFQTKNTSASDAEQFRIEHFDGNVRMNSLRGSLCINEEGGQRVGIATSSPSVKLHVNDNNVLIGNNSSGYATLFFHNEGTGSGRYGSIMKNYDSPFDMRIRASNSTSEMPLVFDGSNDTEYARFDTSGNFGIGDTTPNAKLHISHNGSAVVKAESTASGYGAYSRLTTTTNSYSLVSLNGDFLIDEDGVATRFIIKDSTGNVGINTSSPSATLEVNGTSNFTGQMYIDHGGSDYAPGINFMGGTNTPGSNAYENATIGYYDNSGTGLMRFGINRTGASNYAFYVGTTRSVIMTSTYLAVPDGAYLAAGNDNDVFIRHDGNGHFQSNSGQMYINQVASANMFFSTNNTVRACITNTGELLVSGNDTDIATVAGTGSFQVLGTGGGDTTITIGRFSNNASPPTLSFAKSRNGTIGGNTIVQDGDNLGQITFSASDGTDMVSSSAKIEVEVDGTPGANDTPGRIGFYTTADGANGSVEAMRIDSSQDAHFDQDVIAFSTTPSDIRLKKNFTKIENGLDVVNKLEGHTFNWKKGGDRLSAGFKAQEVEKILPHLVDEKKLPLKSDDDKEYKILRYEEMIPYLVEAIKEQQVQINELKTKLGE